MLGERRFVIERIDLAKSATQNDVDNSCRKRFVVRLDAYVADRERFDTGYGGRVELLVKF